jgi:hypothetical protein
MTGKYFFSSDGAGVPAVFRECGAFADCDNQNEYFSAASQVKTSLDLRKIPWTAKIFS